MRALIILLICFGLSGCILLWDDHCDRYDPEYSHTEYDCYYTSSQVEVCDRYGCWTEQRQVQVCDEYDICYEDRRRR